MSSSNFFDFVVFLVLVLVTGSSFMSISLLGLEFLFIRDLTKNQEIEIIPVWVLSNIWRLRRVKDAKFGMNVSKKKLLNAAKCYVYNFYCFWIINRW